VSNQHNPLHSVRIDLPGTSEERLAEWACELRTRSAHFGICKCDKCELSLPALCNKAAEIFFHDEQGVSEHKRHTDDTNVKIVRHFTFP
jgi:hypothetical protein